MFLFQPVICYVPCDRRFYSAKLLGAMCVSRVLDTDVYAIVPHVISSKQLETYNTRDTYLGDSITFFFLLFLMVNCARSIIREHFDRLFSGLST